MHEVYEGSAMRAERMAWHASYPRSRLCIDSKSRLIRTGVEEDYS